MQRIRTALSALNTTYDEVKSHSQGAAEDTAATLSESITLLDKQRAVSQRLGALHALQTRFILSESDKAILLASGDVDGAFFNALKRAKAINSDCQILLGFDEQTLGRELMEELSKVINLAYQRLYRWTQKELKTLNLESPQMGISLRQALSALSERESLFQECLMFFAEARQRILNDAFHEALTGYSDLGSNREISVKPIDMAAHDPIRYMGDMLAWIHSTSVGEREMLNTFFVTDETTVEDVFDIGRHDAWNSVEGGNRSPKNTTDLLNSLVDKAISGVSRILRQRMEQLVQSNDDAVTAYSQHNLLSFYKATFEALAGNESVLVACIEGLAAEAFRQFRLILRDQVGMLRTESYHTSEDLSPPQFFIDAIGQLANISKSFESSLSMTASNSEASFNEVLVEAFEPFFNGCMGVSRRLPQPESTIFMLNCELICVKKLESYSITHSRLSSVSSSVKNHKAELVRHHHLRLLSSSGIEPLLSIATRGADGTHSDPDPELLATAAQKLDQFLPSAHIDTIERLTHLCDAKMARGIADDAIAKFCADFDIIEAYLSKGQDAEETDIKSIFPRTSAEIRVLLS